jgi:hypothetical protein
MPRGTLMRNAITRFRIVAEMAAGAYVARLPVDQ